MAPPPAKRQRRSAIVLSDDDEPTNPVERPALRSSSRTNNRSPSGGAAKTQTALNAPGTPTQPRAVKRKAPTNISPKKSPAKSTRGKKLEKEVQSSKSLHTFFSKSSEEERWNRKAVSKEQDVENEELEDDIIDDDLLDEQLTRLVDGTRDSESVLDRRKPTSSLLSSGASASTAPPAGSQKFLKPAVPVKYQDTAVRRSAPDAGFIFHRPWADRFGPTSLDELAVHPKKVSDVRGWVDEVLSGRSWQRLLVLKGPAGSGKTTTLDLVSKTLSCSLIHWSNPTVADTGSGLSVAAQFEDFVNRGGQFSSLDFDNDQSGPVSQEGLRRVLVVEEFPSTLTLSSRALTSFRSVLLQYLATASPGQAAMFGNRSTSQDSRPPVVMVISETLLTSSTASTDSFTAHRLLGPEISNHPRVTIMEFNPVAPTFMFKALDLVLKKEARQSMRRRVPGPAVIQRLSEIGDIRSAVNSLEFLCVRDDQSADWSGTVAAKTKKGSKDGIRLTSMEEQSLKLISQRETTLDMFHAAGKIVYNKREDPTVSDPRAEPPPKPPDYLAHLHRPKASQVDVDVLLNETGTDIQTFVSTLHENYVLSCNGNAFIESLEGCSDVLSASDILNPDSRRLNRPGRGVGSGIVALQSGGTDVLRQDEISFQVATRGLLFCLPFPVHRAAMANGRKQDSFKMFYPASLRLWKPTEEIETLVELFLRDGIDSGTHRASPIQSGVASWSRKTSFGPTNTDDTTSEDDSTTLRTEALLLREAAILDHLPYLAKIRQSRRQDTRLISKITHFSGLNLNPTDEPQDEDPAGSEASSTASAGTKKLEALMASTLRYAVPRKEQQQQQEDVPLEKLYLSDDDIVDD